MINHGCVIKNMCRKNFNNVLFVDERKCNQCDGNNACLSFTVYHRTIYTFNLRIKICWLLDFFSFRRPFFCIVDGSENQRNWHESIRYFAMLGLILPCILVSNRLVYCNLCWKPITNFPFKLMPLSVYISSFIIPWL